MVKGDTRSHARAVYGDHTYASTHPHVLRVPEGCLQGVLDESAQGHPQRGHLGLRLHEKLPVDVNGRAPLLLPGDWLIYTTNR